MVPAIRIFVALILSSAFLPNIQASDAPSDTFRLANKAYQDGAVDDAIQLYQAIADRGYGSLPLYFNLGSAYSEKKNWVNARYYLEKAHLENPRHQAVNRNLDFVKEQVDDPYTYPKYPLFTLIEIIHARMGRNIVSILFLLLFLGLLGSIYFTWQEQLPNGKIIQWCLATLFVLTGLLLFFEQTYERFHGRMVVVNTVHTLLYKTPDLEGEIAMELQGGHKLRIQETIGPWFRVDLADGTEGWVTADQVKSLSDRYKKG